jgi:hypothetical protein
MGSIRPRRLAVCGPLACSCALVLVIASPGLARTTTSTRSAATLPSAAQARSIVFELWSLRESALASLDKAAIARVESAAAKKQDQAYVASVRCHCEPQRQADYADQVLPLVPKTSVQPSFFAEVHTKNSHTGERISYLVAVDRVDRTWKIATIALGNPRAALPSEALTKTAGRTVAINASAHRRIAQLAGASIHYAMTRNQLTHVTDYGATVRIRFALAPADGIYGLALHSGQVLSCFTLHSVYTYSHPAGLRQDAARSSWGHQLDPGIYATITTDEATPMCTVGKGSDGVVGVLRFQGERRLLTVKGGGRR